MKNIPFNLYSWMLSNDTKDTPILDVENTLSNDYGVKIKVKPYTLVTSMEDIKKKLVECHEKEGKKYVIDSISVTTSLGIDERN